MEELVAPLLRGISAGKAVPLTTPDLQLLTETMQVRAEELKDRVFGTLKSRYKEIVELVDRASAAALDVEDVESQLQSLLDDSSLTIGGNSFDSTLWKLSTEVKSIRNELAVKKSALGIVKSTGVMRARLLAGKDLFDSGKVLDGAREISKVREAIHKDETTLVMHGLLKQLVSSVYSEVDLVLQDLCSNAVSVNVPKKMLIVRAVNFASSDQKFVEMLEAMEILGLLDGFIGKFTDDLCKFLSLLVHESSMKVEVNSDRATLRIKRSGAKLSSVEDVYQRVMNFVKFMNKHVVQYQRAWMVKLGRSIWPRLADMIIQNHLRKAIPADPTQFEQFEQIQILTSEFEEALEAENFVILDEEGGLLSNFTSDVEVHFSAMKRKELLAKTRHAIIHFDYRSVLDMVAGNTDADGLILKEDDYIVSQLSKFLLTIVQGTLEDACSSTPRLALELYKAARDVVLLYRAIVPSQVSYSGSPMLQAAPMFYNDCLYIAKELARFSEQYSSLLPVDLQQSCTFMDLVPVFQSMGSNILSRQFKAINNQLMQALDNAGGFKSTDETRNREKARSALQEVISVCRTTDTIWQQFLPKSVGVKQLIALADSAIRRIVYEVLSIEDMAADETVQLHNLLDDFMLDMSSVLTVVEKHSRRSLDSKLPSWRKLKRLSEMLEMSLRPITRAWESGILPSAGFSPGEVHGLIKAIFTDTSLRAECLERIS